ncbi:MAG: family 20 glycosylhydrolase, partial [Chthonomonas sp.]|nr:family 20 glycosylhydrolase [Chthonomonas sp.]
VGWDEILEGGLAPGAIVMSWRGEAGGIEAAQHGHDVVMTPGAYTYFDRYQSADKENEPLAIGGCTPIEKVCEYNPVPAGLSEQQAKHVLGSQFQLWTEYMPTPKDVERMMLPRAFALSEVLWSPNGVANTNEFMDRLPHALRLLDRAGINYRPLDRK